MLLKPSNGVSPALRSNGTAPAESEPVEPVSRDLASRLSSLKGKFLSLGRRNRSAEPE